MKKVSFVCTTYRRYTCVNRIIAQFEAQTYPNKELVIFNTDLKYPLELGFIDSRITVINNNIDLQTGLEYSSRGQICRDAVTHATGDYFMLADDDDIYLPWHMEQAVDGIVYKNTDAWKPKFSLFATPDKIELAQNTFEASVIVKMNRIREIGFRTDITGYEGLSWYTKLRDEGQLDEYNNDFIPSYCFNWSDPSHIAGHKQSGNIDAPNNFEEHKAQSLDIALEPLTSMTKEELYFVYEKYYSWIKKNINKMNLEYYRKYAKIFIEQ